MDEYRPVPYQEIFDKLPEDVRRKIEEGGKRLMAEESFWNSLPKVERNKRLEPPKIHYDAESDILWLKNGRPTPRCCDIVEDRVTAYFEADIWYPSAVKVSGAYELLAGFFRPGDSQVSRWPVVQYGEKGVLEKVLQVGNLEIRYTMVSDYLWIGNGVPAWDGREFADELSVSYGEDDNIPVGALICPAAKILAPVFSPSLRPCIPSCYAAPIRRMMSLAVMATMPAMRTANPTR